MTDVNNVTGEQLAILASVIASVIAQDLTTSEQNVLGNFLVTVGSALMTIAAQNEALSKAQSPINC
jgi:hypothetical protein